MPPTPLDAIDVRILRELQADGRLSNVALAERVGLSPSPCLRRVRRLEEDGVIAGYRALLDRTKVGLGLTAFVAIRIEAHHDERAAEVQEALRAMPEVVACHLVSGEADFLLEVVLPDLAAYERLLLGRLLKLPGVRDIRTSFAMRQVKPAAALPLDQLG
ncbi:MAG: Lrp/AsnC family transcriptional regulator [Geminicoccaceae bacterium]